MNFWRNLQPRERLFIGGTGAVLILFLIFKLTIDPLFKYSAELDRQIVTSRRQLNEMRTMQQEYQRQKSVVDSINSQLKKQPNDAILSRLDELASQTGIRNKILQINFVVSTTPSEIYKEELVEVKIDGVTLEQLVRYLHQIENSPQLLKIKKLDIKPRIDNRQILTATFRVSAFTLKEGMS
jgi:general secretion pathway protein M